ncbi:hypothetical protein Acr_04g0004110 [Actinidia rufa]|uniref:Uncharacterized protein n=1 Tax=Actinidia rufa TaxID=165716 RepID=A0A7J0EGR8_9ERIC|nr:hypothetical protein Acr_04g0004110 [Actinidia rufa]
MADENKTQTSPFEGSPQGTFPKVDVPSSPAMELNTMTQGDLARLWETCFFPMGVQTRIPRKGETILSASSREVAFYKAAFSVGLRCLYTLLKGLGLESRWFYFKARSGKNILMGAPSNVKGWKKRLFFASGDDWEFHQSISREEGAASNVIRCQSYPHRGGEIPSGPGEDRRRVLQIPVVLNSRTFYKYFTPSRVEVSSSGGNMAKGDVGGKAEGDIRGEIVVPMDHASESSRSTDGSETRSKKRTLDDGSKEKQVAPLPEAKKTKTGSGVHAAPTRPPVVPGEGGSARRTLGEALGPQASMMASAAMAEKILVGVILPADKEKVEKLTFDQVVTKFLHILRSHFGIFPCHLQQDFVEGALNQRALVESSKMEMVRGQNQAIELEGALTEKKTKGKKAAEEIVARNKVVAKLEAQVAELEKSQNLAQGRIIEASKESDDFLEEVRGSASSYFGNGFDFCKRQLAQQYPNLGIDLEDVEMDQDFLAQEEIEAEKRASEDEGDGEAGVEGKED